MTDNTTRPNDGFSRATASLVLGICSIFAGWILVPPLIGLWLGLTARPRAKWGIALNAIMLSAWVIMIAIALVGIGLYGYNLSVTR